MQRSEIRALGELAGDLLAAAGTLVSDMHEGIASRPFAVLGPVARPLQVIHDGVSSAIYSGVRGGLRAVARGGGMAAALRTADEGAPLVTTLPGAFTLAALNGLYGNSLDANGSALALPMTFSADGDPAPRIAVFIHGCSRPTTPGASRRWGTVRKSGPTYGDRLRDELGMTPLYVRYNTGVHISENGRRLAELLDETVRDWPVPVEEITLVGHSMGGLVARSACHYAALDELRWSDAVRHVVCLGSPHLGADLEKGVNVLGWALGLLPETRAFGELVNARSAGIKDLR